MAHSSGHSRWVTHHGIFESREALAYPGSPERAILLRRVAAIEGAGDIVVELAPAYDYGRRALSNWRREGDLLVADAKLDTLPEKDDAVIRRLLAARHRNGDKSPRPRRASPPSRRQLDSALLP